jgi:hypothetical protein
MATAASTGATHAREARIVSFTGAPSTRVSRRMLVGLASVNSGCIHNLLA